MPPALLLLLSLPCPACLVALLVVEVSSRLAATRRERELREQGMVRHPAAQATWVKAERLAHHCEEDFHAQG